MFVQGFASFYGLLPFGSERCGPAGMAGPVGFSLVLQCSKHDFVCFYKVSLAFMGFLPFGSERGGPAGMAGPVGFSFWL